MERAKSAALWQRVFLRVNTTKAAKCLAPRSQFLLCCAAIARPNTVAP